MEWRVWEIGYEIYEKKESNCWYKNLGSTLHSHSGESLFILGGGGPSPRVPPIVENSLPFQNK